MHSGEEGSACHSVSLITHRYYDYRINDIKKLLASVAAQSDLHSSLYSNFAEVYDLLTLTLTFSNICLLK